MQLMKLIREFGKVVACKINNQKSVAFMYTNNVMAEKEIVRSVPFHIAVK